MASFLYDKFRNTMGGVGTQIDLNDGTLAMFFIDEGTDTPNQTTDDFCDDRTGNNPTFANAPNLAGAGSRVTISSNVMVFDAADLTFTGSSVLTGATSVESIDLFEDSGTNTTSAFIANFDDYTGLPLTPSGSDVVIVFAATGIIRI
jgi:hypothetical protein